MTDTRLPRLEDIGSYLEEVLDGRFFGKGTQYGVAINIPNEVLEKVNDIGYICKLEARREGG